MNENDKECAGLAIKDSVLSVRDAPDLPPLKAIRILIDYYDGAERVPREMIAHEFEIEGSGEHRFAVHNAVDLWEMRPFTATHIQTGFAVARADTIEEAIEQARKNWTTCDPEALALKLIRAKNQTCVPLTAKSKAAALAQAAPASPGLTNGCVDGGDASGNFVTVKMDSRPSTELWTLGNRCYLASAAPAPASPASAPVDEQQKIDLYNDVNRTYGNTNKAITDHLWTCGYRKHAAPAQQAGAPEGWREVMATLAQLVYTQNGNQYDDVTELLEKARAMLAAAPLPPLVARKDGAA